MPDLPIEAWIPSSESERARYEMLLDRACLSIRERLTSRAAFVCGEPQDGYVPLAVAFREETDGMVSMHVAKVAVSEWDSKRFESLLHGGSPA